MLIINGSASYDDLAIVNYTWTRESDSLAVGDIIGNSDHEAVLQVKTINFPLSLMTLMDINLLSLQLTNIVAGSYKYKLVVADEQGLTGSEKVTIIVFEDPLIMNLVEVVLTAQASQLSQQEVCSSIMINKHVLII